MAGASSFTRTPPGVSLNPLQASDWPSREFGLTLA